MGAQVPDMSAAPQCASGANEQYCFAGHCKPAMPPHIFSAGKLGAALPPVLLPVAPALPPASGVAVGGGVGAGAGGSGSCAGGVEGAHAKSKNDTIAVLMSLWEITSTLLARCRPRVESRRGVEQKLRCAKDDACYDSMWRRTIKRRPSRT
jgi:hypothetical protein